MPDTATNTLAAELAGIRDRAGQITGDGHDVSECTADLGGPCSGHDAVRLAGAVERVLTRHRPAQIVVLGAPCSQHENYCHFSITSVEAARLRECPECSASPVTVYTACGQCGPAVAWDQCLDRRDITRALLGEDGTR